MGKNRFWKKILVYATTFMMLFSTMPTSVFADGTSDDTATALSNNEGQIGQYYKVDPNTGEIMEKVNPETGETEKVVIPDGQSTAVTDVDGANWRVRANKTIAPSGEENKFNVTLTVETKDDVQENKIITDSAVVLVFDLSTSMRWCIEHGENDNCNNSRLAAAKTAAKAFIEEYKKTDGGLRKVSIVTFGPTGSIKQYWTTIAGNATAEEDAANLAAVNTAIDTLSIGNQGTNIEAGLLLARNLLSDSAYANDLDGIEYKSVVLLSDGMPTRYVSGNTTSTTPTSYTGRDNNNHECHQGVLEAGVQIHGTEALNLDLYSVFCGTESDDVVYPGSEDGCKYCANRLKTTELLGEISTSVVSASNADELTQAFKDIAEEIQVKTQAWQGSDPMGPNAELSDITSTNNNNFVKTENKLDWNILESEPISYDETTGIYTYQITYEVTLDTLAEGFDFNSFYATNGVTKLTYYFAPKDGSADESPEAETLYFNIPAVQGYEDGYYELNKVDDEGNALAGATFTLVHDCDSNECDKEWTMEAVSDANGKVAFEKIPSGHKYKLVETSAPDGYAASKEENTLEVKFGTVHVNGKTEADTGFNITVANEEIVVTNISGTKTWNHGNNSYYDRPTSITVNLYANGVLKDSQVVSANTNWQYSFKNVPAYDENGAKIVYTVLEETVANYLPSYSDPKETEDGVICDITNTYSSDKNIVVNKIWNDANDQDGKRPRSISVQLRQKTNYTNWQNYGDRVTLNEANGWSYTFEDLPERSNRGYEYTYSVRENISITDYDTEITANGDVGYIITNSYTPEVTSISGTKSWDDDNDYYGFRPNSVSINLIGTVPDGNDTTTVVEKTVVAKNKLIGPDWTYEFTNLPVYFEGKEITYTITEDPVPNYELINDANSYNVTNKYIPETVSVSGTKTWDDADNQDGKRPESITINLLADGEPAGSQEVTAENGWAWTFENLPKHKERGAEIEYTITEDAVTGYTSEVNGYNVTNTHVPETTEATVKKVWNDADNQDGKRPESLTVTLSNGTEVTLNERNNWTATVTDLPKFANGQEINYTWTEGSMPEGYTLTDTSVNGTVTTLTNSYTPEVTTATVTKVWDDAENQDNKRPESLTVTLSNGTEVTLNEANQWTATVENLPKYADGVEIEYTWTEGDMPEGYELSNTSVNGTVTTLTNSHTPETTEATVTKVWDDAENQDGKRPETLTVTLINGTATAGTVILSEANNWTATVTDLPKFANGQLIEYTWTEGDMPEGYELTDTTKDGTVTTLTNSYTPEVTEATVTKVWDDADNQDGKRPESLTVTLSNGTTVTLSADNEWTATVTDLPKFANGQEITYAWTEGDMPEGYALSGTTVNGTVTTLTNSYTPETTEASVIKVWDDADNQDGKRPAGLTVTLSNGTEVTLNEANGWTATVENLPAYAAGKLIEYTWTEGDMPEGYTLSGTSVNGTITTLTNSYTPETTEASVTKVWDDADNQDGKRPESLTVTLSNGTTTVATVTLNEANDWTAKAENLPKYANGQEIVYTWTEETLPAGYTLTDTSKEGTVTTLTNSYTPEVTEATVTKVWDDAENQDGKRPVELNVTLKNGDGILDAVTVVTLNEENNWTATVTDLPKYKDGTLIEYTWEEDGVREYTPSTPSVNGTVTTLTNSYTPETTEASVTKVWDDADNQDGKRPESLTVTLSNGEEVTLNERNQWTAKVENLPKYANGKLIEYTWTEGSMPEGYTLTGSATEGTVTTLTNSYTPEVTEASIKKVWDDANNQDGKRPAELKVTLSNGTEVTLNERNQWTATVEDLPKYEDGVEIAYTWTEGDMPEGYALTGTTKDGTVTTLTNTYEPEVTEASVTKVWNDANNQDGKRPESLTVTLSNGTEVTLNEANGWTAKVENLPAYEAGKLIEYTWTEGDMPDGYALSDTSVNGTITTLTNSYTPEVTEATVTKVWDDADNQDGKRPAGLTVTLSNGTAVTLNEANQWTAKVDNLPKYADGVEIEYTWTEGDMPKGYTLTDTSVNGTITTLTNSYTPEVTEASIKKVWDDANNQDGKRPESLTVTLSNGTEVTLNEANGWTATVEKLPKYADGVEIDYKWAEGDMPEGYTLTGSATEGTVTTLTNSYTPEETSVTVKKVWDDADNQDGKRPTTLTVTLSNGTEVTLNKANDWTETISGLPKYADGKLIEYTWTEETLPDGYELKGNVVENSVATLTNTHTPEETEATVTKVWNDADDQDGKRPESLTVTLSNGTGTVETVTLNEDNEWTATVTDLPKYANGTEIVYTWAEGDMPEGYELTGTSVVDTVTTLTNTHEPEVTTASIKKVWDDADNQDGKRPTELTVTLSNGTEVTLNEANNWEATVEDLPAYEAGELIEYTWTEADIEGYELTGTVVSGVLTTITNSHVPEVVEIDVFKTWKDKRDKYEKRPEVITVYLHADGEIVQTVQVKESDKWRYTFTELPKYADGKEIAYTVSEKPVKHYTTDIEGFNITNTLDPSGYDETSDTGDNTKPWAYGLAGLMAMLTAAGAVFLRRRED